MNRFERLFFILEKNETASHAGVSEPRGVIKIIITSDKMRVMAEINNLNINDECRYELAIFTKDKNSEGNTKPKFIAIEANQHGNVRMDSEYSYSGGEICGVALASLRKNNPGMRQYPMVSFKIKQDEWRKVLSMSEKVAQNREPDKKAELTEQKSMERESTKQLKKEPQLKEPQLKEHSNGEPPKQEINKKELPEREMSEKEYKPVKNSVNKEESRELPSSKNTNDETEIVEDKIDRDEFFNKHFTGFDPFNTTNKSYKWWRGSDMHQINRVLVEMGIRLPFELNKEGYLACELFGNILLGTYKDRVLDREFFILGIPAKNRDGAGNYYSNSRWEETGSGRNNDESGYWLTYIDCGTSKVVKVI